MFRPLSPRPAWLAWALAAPLAAAATSMAPAAPLRPQDVALLASTCVNCHGPHGQSTGGIPNLRGADAQHLLQRMQAFKANQAPDATIMNRLMQGYDAAQIQALATWFAHKEQP